MRSKDILYYGAPFLVAAGAFGCQIINREKTPGGVWLKPDNGAKVSRNIDFAARAYPAKKGRDPEVKEVQFTVSWKGRPGPWIIACKKEVPTEQDVYSCTWDSEDQIEEVPAGELKVSFDVTDLAGNKTEAPNGVHTVNSQP